MPTGYLLVFYWTVAALGGALFLGTGAALLRYRRTGTFPGQPPGEGPLPEVVRRRVLLRCVVGFGVTAAGLVGVASVAA